MTVTRISFLETESDATPVPAHYAKLDKEVGSRYCTTSSETPTSHASNFTILETPSTSNAANPTSTSLDAVDITLSLVSYKACNKCVSLQIKAMTVTLNDDSGDIYVGILDENFRVGEDEVIEWKM